MSSTKKNLSKKTLVIMAAGLGSRYGGLKQVDALGPNGEFLIDYTIYDAWQTGFTNVVLIIRPGLKKEFQAHFANKIFTQPSTSLPPIKIQFSIQKTTDLPDNLIPPSQRKKPWGTGHALLTARKLVKNPFVVLTADDFYGRSTLQILSQALDKMQGQQNFYAMPGSLLINTLSPSGSVSRGLCRQNDENCLISIHEHTNIVQKNNQILSIDKTGTEHILEPDRLVSMAIFAFTPEFFDYLNQEFKLFLQDNLNDLKMEFFTPNVVNNLIHENKVKMKIYPTTSPWFGLTNPDDRQIAVKKIQQLIKDGQYPSKI